MEAQDAVPDFSQAVAGEQGKSTMAELLMLCSGLWLDFRQSQILDHHR